MEVGRGCVRGRGRLFPSFEHWVQKVAKAIGSHFSSTMKAQGDATCHGQVKRSIPFAGLIDSQKQCIETDLDPLLQSATRIIRFSHG